MVLSIKPAGIVLEENAKKVLRISVACLSLAAVLMGCPAPSNSGSNSGPTGPKIYNIGDTGPAGGLIFYDQGSVINGWRYMEAAPSNLSSLYEWAGFSYVVTGVTDITVGAGQANTTALVGLGTFYYAATACHNLVLNGYSDWFLPSLDELMLVANNLQLNGLGNFPTDNVYWTSCEYDRNSARIVNMTTPPTNSYYDKGSVGFYVRAVRRFAP